MLTPEEQGVIEGRGVAEFRKALTEANFDGAKVIEREYMLPPQAVGSIVNATFDNFISVQRFVDAIGCKLRRTVYNRKVILSGKSFFKLLSQPPMGSIVLGDNKNACGVSVESVNYSRPKIFAAF